MTAMRQPTERDFDITVDREDGVVRAFFKPTESTYEFILRPDGSISQPQVRHAKTGDTDDYIDREVGDMATRLAEQAAAA
jgi:hypothetical protein